MGENYISCREENGSIHISEDVIVSIVRNTVSDVEGVSSLSSAAGSEIAELVGLKMANKGVKIRFEEDKIIADVIINVGYGNNVMQVAKNVQEKLLGVILDTTGFEKAEVNVHVSGITFDR